MKLYTTKSAAERLGISEHEARRLCRTGKLACQRYGHVWLIPESALLARALARSAAIASRSR